MPLCSTSPSSPKQGSKRRPSTVVASATSVPSACCPRTCSKSPLQVPSLQAEVDEEAVVDLVAAVVSEEAAVVIAVDSEEVAVASVVIAVVADEVDSAAIEVAVVVDEAVLDLNSPRPTPKINKILCI